MRGARRAACGVCEHGRLKMGERKGERERKRGSEGKDGRDPIQPRVYSVCLGLFGY